MSVFVRSPAASVTFPLLTPAVVLDDDDDDKEVAADDEPTSPGARTRSSSFFSTDTTELVNGLIRSGYTLESSFILESISLYFSRMSSDSSVRIPGVMLRLKCTH